MSTDLAPAIVTGSVAAVAIVVNGVISWRAMTNQRTLAHEQRTWDAVRDLYVDLMMYSERCVDAVERTQRREYDYEAWPFPVDETYELDARAHAYASDAVQQLHNERRVAFFRYQAALKRDVDAYPGMDFSDLPEHTSLSSFNAYFAAERALREGVRAELLLMRERRRWRMRPMAWMVKGGRAVRLLGDRARNLA